MFPKTCFTLVLVANALLATLAFRNTFLRQLPLRAAAPSKEILERKERSSIRLDMAPDGDKLIYDPNNSRFYEGDCLNDQGETEFCLLDPDTQAPILLTREEKERIFLDAVQSYYFSGKQILTDKEFDRLREDLSWEGSALVTMNRNETLFLNAMAAYKSGKPIMNDLEFDELKKTLRTTESKIAVGAEPTCYIDTGICKVTWFRDTVRTSSLYLPATLILTTLYLGLTYEIPFIRSSFNPIVLLLIGGLPLYVYATQITENFLFDKPMVAAGPCPNCGVENKVFFGDVLGVSGDKSESKVKCTNCKCTMTIKRSTLRVSSMKA